MCTLKSSVLDWTLPCSCSFQRQETWTWTERRRPTQKTCLSSVRDVLLVRAGGRGTFARALWTRITFLFFLQQNPCVRLGVDAVAIHSPPSVVWLKDSGVLLTGRGGVMLSSAV